MDQKRRVVLPIEVAEQLGLVEGSEVTFEKEKGMVIIKKAGKKEDTLRKIMSWNPKRTRRTVPVKEAEVKEIWR
ncbi:MAG: AbrB/MazE/SpoVT family DNA-binding domain-containing protein [Thaumarchaeota archaeon]|nr:AbrB/MazE/SpoVT family DNA-binding domain-containing protein [Nitrososphaerota archaeon]